MNFMHPMLLLGALGIALPILAHLLNKHQPKQTPWAAMQFLNRAVRVRSRQMRLRDILLLLLRCLAVLLLVLAISKPAMENADGLASRLGERRAGVVIALDASFSMQHSDGTTTRFERAIEKIEVIAANLHPGDPVCLVLLGAEHRVVVRNMAFDAERFMAILRAQRATPEPLDLDSVPRRLQELAEGMDAPQKEIYLVTDMQEQDWQHGAARLRDAFADLAQNASLLMVPVQGDSDNLAITSLELVSGVLRKGTIARYRATVRNFGASPVVNVMVKGLVNNINVDTKTIPSIAAGASETVSLFVPFHNSGPAKITAQLDTDALPVDNSRRAVAIIRDRVSVLCVEGSSGSAGNFGGFVAAALRARGDGAGEEDFAVQSVPWIALPAQDLKSFDVVILADVPAITPVQARQFEEYVRAGNGLVWFPGDQTKAAVWNQRSAIEGTPLLPAVIEQTVRTSDALGVGRPLDPIMPDHSVCRPLRSLSEDLLSETRFLKRLQVKPSATSVTVLSLAGSASPLLIEHALGRGHVFMFTTSAEPTWNNMAVTPVFPMLLQQMVTYLTAREFEKPRLVGNSLSLSYVDQPDASDAVFDTPLGQTITVPVREHRNQYVALLEHAEETGFYLARVSVQAPGMPVAVNVDTRESNVKCLSASELVSRFEGSGVLVTRSDTELLDAIAQTRTGRSFWRFFMIAGLVLLLMESLFADRLLKKLSPANERASSSAHTENL
jgi:uncharacterized membrane protein